MIFNRHDYFISLVGGQIFVFIFYEDNIAQNQSIVAQN